MHVPNEKYCTKITYPKCDLTNHAHQLEKHANNSPHLLSIRKITNFIFTK